MDENAKLIKSVIILNIITLVVVIVLLGLQVYLMVSVKPAAPIDQQKQETQKTPDSASQSQQQNGGTMPTGQMPTGQQSSGIQNEKCGDGVCDAIEKANPNLCAKDCSQ